MEDKKIMVLIVSQMFKIMDLTCCNIWDCVYHFKNSIPL